jgi:hypothetical protein
MVVCCTVKTKEQTRTVKKKIQARKKYEEREREREREKEFRKKEYLQGQQIVLRPPKRVDKLWVVPSLLFSGYRGAF